MFIETRELKEQKSSSEWVYYITLVFPQRAGETLLGKNVSSLLVTKNL